MKLPINWLQDYVDIKHNTEEIGRIMTLLDSMQDGPIETVEGTEVLDLETRQNRPDLLSIIGLATEYAAYTNQMVKYPETWIDNTIKKQPAETLFKVESNEVLRFSAIKINNVFISESPEWLQQKLRLCGINPINNIVDITNFVMIEYGIPMHAFDYNKLEFQPNVPPITITKIEGQEKFTTWQGTEINLSSKDLILKDSTKILGMAGISGDPMSGVSENTGNIIIEAANYLQSSVRKSSLRNNIRTESSLRHEKFLSSNMVEVAMRRATHLILELCGGTVERYEDYYPNKEKNLNRVLTLNINEFERLAGVQLEVDLIKEMLSRLKFQIIDHQNIVEIANNNLIVKIPDHRTDITVEEHLIGEVLRLWGYDNIPERRIDNAPPTDITSQLYILKRNIKDLTISLGYDEQINHPFTSKQEENSIVLENSINKVQNKLRTRLNEGLTLSIDNHKKYDSESIKVFEVGKVYAEVEDAYIEREISSFRTFGIDFKKIKGDLQNILQKLGYNIDKIDTKIKDDKINYFYNSSLIATLYKDGFDLNNEIIIDQVNLKNIPALVIQIKPIQRIIESITISVPNDITSASITKSIHSSNEFIDSVVYVSDFRDELNNINYQTYEIEITDQNNSLTRDKVNSIINQVVKNLETINCYIKK